MSLHLPPASSDEFSWFSFQNALAGKYLSFHLEEKYELCLAASTKSDPGVERQGEDYHKSQHIDHISQ